MLIKDNMFQASTLSDILFMFLCVQQIAKSSAISKTVTGYNNVWKISFIAHMNSVVESTNP